ncbi:hypothetical protein [Holophaga foetida]|uniref:hypothetical protein n=1 Tax=Holophaga foetida TaxID=35839 RepID=UPI00024750C3|nr:hypothetical protein [Holophaga foetida]
MANGLLILILLMTAIAAVLAGMGVFSNSRPPDSRLNQILDDLDEIKGVMNALQKSVMQMERKSDKDQRDTRSEVKEMVDKATERLEKKIQELG